MEFKGGDKTIIKEGALKLYDKQNDEWVSCKVLARKDGITLNSKQKVVAMKISSLDDIKITIMPDHARRSRESKLYPFSIMNPKVVKSFSSSCEEKGGNDEEYILACMDGRSMWDWASTIKYLGGKPKERIIPLFFEARVITNHNEHYENPNVLQDTLLEMFTYKNLPQKPVSFDNVAAIDRNLHCHFLSYINYPLGFTEEFTNDSALSSYLKHHRKEEGMTYYFIDYDNYDRSSGENSKMEEKEEESMPLLIENHEYLFGLFAYLVLVGSCIQVNEKCFELITSTKLYDLTTQAEWKGNSPFSMLCEGDYNPSRNYMISALWKLGYPKLDNFRAGCCRSECFTTFIAKPNDLWEISNIKGRPVHLDDQKLCHLLKKNGDGRKANETLSRKLIEAAKLGDITFESQHRRSITAINIPSSVMSWGFTTLTKLDLTENGIFELPDEIYEFANLTQLKLTGNCLFGLSHKLGNLTKLKELDICYNLITELPDSIEKLEELTEFNCSENPITKPPSAIWERGIANVRSFFKDMRESGTERNVDLKVLVLGLSEAGKTSLINGLIQPNEKALTRVGDRTVGIEKRTWSMKRERNNDEEEDSVVNFLIYDFAGQEEYYITHHLFLGSKALYILAFDISKFDEISLDQQILLWWDSIQNRVCDIRSNDSITPKVIIVGTHADILYNAQDAADEIHKNLEKRFNQRRKYLTDRIAILDKEQMKLDPRYKKEGTVHSRERKYNALPLNTKIQIQTFEYEIQKLRHQKQCTIALPSRIYAVSSKNFYNYEKLREQIALSLTEIGPSGKYFPQLDERLPASWFRLRKFVREQSTRKGRECMKLPQYFKLISDELGINEDVGIRATRFCHELGDILFFEKEGLVFLRPSLLIDIFKLVIRHDHMESTYWRSDMEIDEETFNKGKDLLLEKGELEEWFLDILWSPINDEIGPASNNIRNNLIQLLETFDIATPIEYRGKKQLLIPEFQPKSISSEFTKDFNSNCENNAYFEMQRWVCVAVDDHNNSKLPHGLLKRIQVRVMKKIFKRRTNEFYLAQHEFLMKDSIDSTMLYCKQSDFSNSENEEGELSPGRRTSSLLEGIRFYIRGQNKFIVSSLLRKVHSCVKDTMKDYPGLIFEHYAVKASNKGPLFIRMEELEARCDAGETKVFLTPIINKKGLKGKYVKVGELLPTTTFK